MKIYGTEEAKIASRAISRLIPGCKILDPERIPWKELQKQYGYDKVAEMAVRQADRIVVYEYMGHIGRGVSDEIDRAVRLKKPVHVLRAPVPGLEQFLLYEFYSWGRVQGGNWQVTYGRVRCHLK